MNLILQLERVDDSSSSDYPLNLNYTRINTRRGIEKKKSIWDGT